MDRVIEEQRLVDDGDGRWVTALAVSLLQQKASVEDFLRKAKRLVAFQNSIAAWNKEYPGTKPSDVHAKAQALVTIVHEYGIQSLVIGPESGNARTRGVVRTKGAVRTRGGVPTALDVHDVLAQVAAAYQIAS